MYKRVVTKHVDRKKELNLCRLQKIKDTVTFMLAQT